MVQEKGANLEDLPNREKFKKTKKRYIDVRYPSNGYKYLRGFLNKPFDSFHSHMVKKFPHICNEFFQYCCPAITKVGDRLLFSDGLELKSPTFSRQYYYRADLPDKPIKMIKAIKTKRRPIDERKIPKAIDDTYKYFVEINDVLYEMTDKAVLSIYPSYDSFYVNRQYLNWQNISKRQLSKRDIKKLGLRGIRC